MKLKLLLLQARTATDPMKEHEHRCFIECSGLTEEDVLSHNLIDGPPSFDQVREFDALMVGGSGEFYVSKRNLPHHEQYLDLLRGVVERSHPLFAA